MNFISILGTLTKDVELTYTNNGAAIGKFSIAYNDSYISNGKKVEKSYFFNVVVFGRRAEVIHQYFKKGNRILVQGKLVQDRWEDSSGNKRTAYSIQLTDFDFIDRANKQQNQRTKEKAPETKKKYQPTIDIDDDTIPF